MRKHTNHTKHIKFKKKANDTGTYNHYENFMFNNEFKADFDSGYQLKQTMQQLIFRTIFRDSNLVNTCTCSVSTENK